MKNLKKLSIFLLMITIAICINTRAFANTGKVTTETLRMREKASTDSKVIEQLSEDDEIEILEEQEDWYKVKYKEYTGYVSSKYVKVQEENENTNPKPVEDPDEVISSNKQEKNTNPNNEQTAEVETTKVISNEIQEKQEYQLNKEISIKILPLINSTEIEKISSGKITILEKINDWYKIETEKQIGWIRAKLLKVAVTIQTSPAEEPTTTTEEQAPVEEQEKTQTGENENTDNTSKVIATGYVSTESLFVREKPDASSKAIDSLVKNIEVEILEKLDGWYKIKSEDRVGYVSSKYISDKKVTEVTSRGNVVRDEQTTSNEVKNENTSSTINSSNKGDEVVALAKTYMGYDYVSGGASPSTGFDCSGFTQYIYKQFGINLNRTSSAQSANGVAVNKSQLQLGDLVLFNGESNKSIGHVGIYIGDGEFIHASNPKGGVKITSLSLGYYADRYVGARRVL